MLEQIHPVYERAKNLIREPDQITKEEIRSRGERNDNLGITGRRGIWISSKTDAHGKISQIIRRLGNTRDQGHDYVQN